MTINWSLNDIDDKLIELALQEDLDVVFHDATTQTLFDGIKGEQQSNIISKHPEPILLSGMPLVTAILDAFQTEYKIDCHYQDGDIIEPGKVIATITGNPETLLMAERTILNFLRRLCAVATSTHQFVEKIKHTDTKILDTRKTTPGFRHLEKYAVHCGGGVNHRMGLYDAIMIKDNHIDLIGGVKKALAKLPEKSHDTLNVVVEVRDTKELKEVIKYGRNKVNRVLLDNMEPALMKECTELCHDVFDTEASGNLNIDTIVAAAESGVDFASVGMITHSAGNVDLSMKAKR